MKTFEIELFQCRSFYYFCQVFFILFARIVGDFCPENLTFQNSWGGGQLPLPPPPTARTICTIKAATRAFMWKLPGHGINR